MSNLFRTNFPVANEDNTMLESSPPLIIMLLSIAEVTQSTAAVCSLEWNNQWLEIKSKCPKEKAKKKPKKLFGFECQV